MAYSDIFYDLGIGFSSGFLGKTGDTLTNFLKFNEANLIQTNSSNIEFINNLDTNNKLTLTHKDGTTETLLATYNIDKIDYTKPLFINNYQAWTKEILPRPVTMNINDKFDSLAMEEGMDKGLSFGSSKLSYIDANKDLIIRTKEIRFGADDVISENDLFGMKTDVANKLFLLGTPASTYFSGSSAKYNGILDGFDELTINANEALFSEKISANTFEAKKSFTLPAVSTNTEFNDDLFHISSMNYNSYDLTTELINKIKAHIPRNALYNVNGGTLTKDIGSVVKAFVYKDISNAYLIIGTGTIGVDTNRPYLDPVTDNLIFIMNDEYDNIFTLDNNNIIDIDISKLTQISLTDITIDNILDVTVYTGETFEFLFKEELVESKEKTVDTQIASKGTIAFGSTLSTKSNEKQIHIDTDNGFVYANRFYTEDGTRIVSESMISDLMASSGLNDLADVAKTGSYNDLVDVPLPGMSYVRK